MTDDLKTRLTELTDARPEPADPAATVRLGIQRRRHRRRSTGAVLVTAAATAGVLVAGPALGTFRAGGTEPPVGGNTTGTTDTGTTAPVTTATTATSTAGRAATSESGPRVLPPPWSDKVFTKMPDANAYGPKAYYIAEGRIPAEQWSVLVYSDYGLSAGCLVTDEGPANSFGRPLSCFDEWPKGRRIDYQVVQGHSREKSAVKADATMVLGAVSVAARRVEIRTKAGRTYYADAVGTPVSDKLRFFAAVLPVKDVRIASIKPLDAAGRLAAPPTGLPEKGGRCVVQPNSCVHLSSSTPK